jgi:hypothetical protein
MSDIRVVRHHELDPEKIQISQPILNPKTNVLHCQMYYEGSPFFLETPYLKSPFGLHSYQKGETGKTERSITLMATGNYTDALEVITPFFEKLRQIDRKILAYASRHSETIFGETRSEETIETGRLFDSGVRGKLDANGVPYPDKISPRVASTQGRPDVYLFRNSKTPIEIPTWDDLDVFVVKGRSMKGIIEPRIFIMRNRKIGLMYEYHQIKLPSLIMPKQPKKDIYAFGEEI